MLIELRDMLIAYFRQQTLVPFQQLGRYLAFGAAGSLLMGVGVLLMSLGCLRLLQTETGTTFTGNWSWVPYIIVFVALIFGTAIIWKAKSMIRTRWEPRR